MIELLRFEYYRLFKSKVVWLLVAFAALVPILAAAGMQFIMVELGAEGEIDEIIESESWRDAKSFLQVLSQHIDNVTPVYRVIKEEGPDHDKMFTLGVFINDHLKATGIGHSKQEAQVKAASEAIRQYKREHPKEVEEFKVI